MAIPVDSKKTTPKAQVSKAKSARGRVPLKRTGYAKTTRDEMSAGKGMALRSAAEQKLAARPFSATGETAAHQPGFRVGPGGALMPTTNPATTTPDGGTIINPKLHGYLLEHPEIRTVQDLVNACYHQPGGGWGTFESTCKSLDLDPVKLNGYRTAKLEDWAVRYPAPEGVPHTVDEANAYFLNQYRTDFNEYASVNVTNNCGPTSLAMCMEIEGQMPEGLNEEQRIDYARALMYPGLEKRAYRPAVDPNGEPILDFDGNQVMLLDRDSALTGMGDEHAGIVAGAENAGIDATHQTGWEALDDALATGHPVVVEGNITESWRKAVAAGGEGSYAGGGDGHFIAVLGVTDDGKYLVADPMYSGGTVEMDKDQLKLFFSKQGDSPSFAGPPPAP